MKYGEISPTMRAFIGGREAFRKMGFKADDLYCSISMSARHMTLSCFVKLQAQNKEFNLEVGSVEDGVAFEKEYRLVAEAINQGKVPQADINRMWQESEVFQDKMGFLAAFAAKGFVPPKSLS